MSLKDHECKSNWALCPVDILLVVFKKLDIKSLLNCMNVNIYWRNIVEYYCEHANLWKAMVQNTIDDEGVTFAEKSNLGWREQFLTAQQWFNVRNITVHLRHCYKFNSSIRNIYVHKDNLIVVTNIAVKYFNIANFENIKVIDKSFIRYQETSSMIVELSVTPEGKFSPVLTLTNKLYANYVDSEKVKKIILEDIDSFKVHLNSCYEYSNKVLWVHTAKEIGWETKAMAKYHGIHQFCSLHIFKKNVYILLKSGTVLILDMECKLLVSVFHFNIPKLYQKLKPLMFHMYSLLFKAPNPHFGQCVVVDESRHNHFVTTMACYAVTCVLAHGHILILGFEDGKIDIYLTRNLIEPSQVALPELRLNLKDYLCKTNQPESSLSIISLDIYEDTTGHHLFISTMFNVFELLLL